MAFAVQAGLLLGLGVLRPGAGAPAAGVVVQGLGRLLAVTGLVFYPLAGLLAGRPWTQAEVFGIAPEPTALVSLGLLLAGGYPPSRARRYLLAVIPTLALLVGAATLWMMHFQ